MRLLRRLSTRFDKMVGGPLRGRLVVTLAAVLALDSADKATIGASSTQIQQALHIGRAQIGLLLSTVSLVGALASVPAGVLVDRFTRTRLLLGAVLVWSGVSALSGLLANFLFFLLVRLLLGLLTAVAAPAVASLLGDYVAEQERGRMYGYVLAGELIGAGFGFVVTGELAALSWRAPFFMLAVPGLMVAYLLRRLAEPERGGGSRLPARREPSDEPALAASVVEEFDVQPRPGVVIRDDPQRWPLPRAVKFVLAIRSNLVLITASCLGYFFFTGIRGFGVAFAKGQYGISQAEASALTLVLGIGALAGVLIGGRLGDRLLFRRRRPAARVEVAGTVLLLTVVLFIPALLSRNIAIAGIALTLAAACLGATNPPTDSARLDIMPAPLWGRAEAVRSVARTGAEALAPLLFGFLSGEVFAKSTGLRDTFLVMLVPLVAAAVLVLVVGRRTYPRDVVTAAAAAAEAREASVGEGSG